MIEYPKDMPNKPGGPELLPGPGFRVRRRIPRPAPADIEKLRGFSSADLSDALNRMYAVGSEIRLVAGTPELIGPACTVRVYPGDNLMVHKSLDIALPGDVLVIDGGVRVNNGLVGGLIAAKARHRGIAGIVVDGLVRDHAELLQIGLPIFSRGITAQGPLHRGPGEINFAVTCGGVVVHPGDLVRGDSDGVAVVPRDFVNELASHLAIRSRRMKAYAKAVKRGKFSNEWVDRILTGDRCQFLEGESG